MKRSAPYPDLAGFYDRLAPDYDRLHRRWLRHAGGEAQAALEATVRAVVAPGMQLLDAGCGTGAFARRLVAEAMVPLHVTLLDPSDAMLSRCADITANCVQGRLEHLPFPDGHFDIVTCAWALETVPDTDAALNELTRVVRPGGVLCMAFCSDTPVAGLGHRLTRKALLWRGAGRFLSERLVSQNMRERREFDLRRLPCSGPVSALVARREPSSERSASDRLALSRQHQQAFSETRALAAVCHLDDPS